MRSIRRVGGLAVAGLLLSTVAGGSAASAQAQAEPAKYAGSASGYALKVTLAGQGITAGSSAVQASSDGVGAAEGAGVLAQANTTAKATNPPGETKPETCGDAGLDAVEVALTGILELGLGCGTASATGAGATSVASANGKIAKLDVNGNVVLSQLPLQDVTGPVNDVLEQVCTGLTAAPATPLPVTVAQACDAVADTGEIVLESLQSTQTLASEIGSSTSDVAVAGNAVTTESTASGAIIKILPLPTLNGVPLGEPVATITVSRANAKVLCDLGSGSETPSFDPAIVRVKLSAPIVALLPDVPDGLAAINLPANPIITGVTDPKVAFVDGELTVTPGSTVVLFPNTPIQTEIVVGNGSTKTNDDGTASAVADGVKIHALQNIGATIAQLAGPPAGLLVNLSHAEATGGCVAATLAAPPVVETPLELPRTGPGDGGTPWAPIAAAAGLSLAFMVRRFARSH